MVHLRVFWTAVAWRKVGSCLLARNREIYGHTSKTLVLNHLVPGVMPVSRGPDADPRREV